MIRFVDGPVAGESLLLRRAPLFLRVVVSPTGKVDALDQLDDEPAPRETIHVYRQVTEATDIHLNFGGSNRSTGFYKRADYAHVPDVDGESVRQTPAWRSWCQSRQVAR